MSALPKSPIALSLETAIDLHPLTVTSQTLVLEAITLMHRHRDRCHLSESAQLESESENPTSYLLVVESEKLIGLLTERDLVRLAAQGMNLVGVTVAEVMTQPLITAKKSQLHDVFSVLNLFREHRIRHLPIVNQTDELLGMLDLEGISEGLEAAYLLKLRRVAEVMTTEVIHALPSASVREVAQLMSEHQVSSVVICQSEPTSDRPIPLGIITERDIVQFQTLQLNLAEISAQQVMSTPLWTIEPEDSLWTVHQKMHSWRIRHLVVCQPLDPVASSFWRRRENSLGQSAANLGKLLGIVTQRTIVQALNPSEMFNMIYQLQQEVSAIEQEKIHLLNDYQTFLAQQVQERTQQIEQQADYQRLLGTVAQKIRQSLNLEEILTTTVQEIRHLLSCDRVLIYKYHSAKECSMVAESVNPSCECPLISTISDSDLVFNPESVNSEDSIRAISDIYTTSLNPWEIKLWQQIGFRAVLLVPIIHSKNNRADAPKYWGFLIAGQCQNPREWQFAHLELLEQLATQLTIAIQQSTLLQQVKTELVERQQAETALAQQHNFVSAILDVIGALVVVLDCQGRILKFNQACEHTTGYSCDEVVGRYLWDLLLLPEETEAVSKVFNALTTGNFPNQHQNYWRTKDGQLRLISWSNTCLTNPQGQVEYAIATGIDITDRDRAETALKQLNEELETRVTQRTAALQTLNQELQKQIRDRQQAESESQKLLAAVEAASDGIAIFTQKGYRYLNQAHVELFGYDNAQELLGKTWQQLYPPDESERLQRHILPILNQQKYWRGEAIAQRKDGSHFTEELSLTLTEHNELICVCRNIDRRKQIEQDLRSSEARFRATFEQAAVGIVLFSLTGRFLKFNQKFQQIFGYSEAELLSKSVFDVTYSEDLATTRQFMEALLQGKMQTISLEKRCLRKDGTLVWVNVTVSLIAESDDRPDYFLSVVEDISDRQESETKLQKALKELAYHKQALDKFAIVTITDPQGIIVYVNDKFCEISGYSRAEAIGQTHRIVNSGYHPKSFFKQLWSTISSGKIWQAPVKNKTKNGEYYWVDTTIVPFLNDCGEPFQYLAIRIDITERQQAEALIQASLNEKEVLLKEIHHRVKNNLQVISSLLDLQSQYIEDPELLSQFEDSQNRIQSMALIHEKLYQSNDLSYINFGEYVENLIDHLFLSYDLGTNQIEPNLKITNICLNLDTAIPCGLIINELVSNALKHGFPHGAKGKISVDIYPSSDSDRFIVAIADNGIGFPSDLDFEQVESSLGLQLVCTLTQQLRGTIELDRSHGTQFTLNLAQIKKTRQFGD